MENGVEALKMASAVLIFVLAITITISSFTSASQALRRIFAMQDDEYVTMTDEDGNEYFLNYVRFDGGTREVGVETIVPAMYRAYKENYVIYFYNSSGGPLELYKTLKNGVEISVNYIDLEQESHASPENAIEHLEDLLQDSFYEKIKDKTFIEKLGEYYINDVSGESGIAEVNKTKKRIIVYTQK